MNKNIAAECVIDQVTNPAQFYANNAEELAIVGADAFGQPVELFQPQVAERFEKAGLAQVLRHGKQIVGFALYDILQGHHWRLTVN